jgi:hypothetical protein
LNDVEQPGDIHLVQAAPAGETRTVVEINNVPPQLQAAMTKSKRFAENRRLHKAIMDKLKCRKNEETLLLL